MQYSIILILSARPQGAQSKDTPRDAVAAAADRSPRRHRHRHGRLSLVAAPQHAVEEAT